MLPYVEEINKNRKNSKMQNFENKIKRPKGIDALLELLPG